MLSNKVFCHLHIHISSTDRPGILAEALQSVTYFNWNVLDIKQFVFNGLLNLSLLLGGNESHSVPNLQKALESWAIKNKVTIKILPWDRELYEDTPFTPGAEDLVRILQHLGYRIALVSGWFQFFADRIKKKYNLDYGVANQLEVTDGKLTGKILGDIIDARAKEQTLVSITKKEGFSLKQVVAVGDGANDIHMLARGRALVSHLMPNLLFKSMQTQELISPT